VNQNDSEKIFEGYLELTEYYVRVMTTNTPVAPKDQTQRISVDITDIRQRIESCRTDSAWSELSLTGKIRSLLIDRLDQLEGREERIDVLIQKLEQELSQ
jgi:hypothetical protein